MSVTPEPTEEIRELFRRHIPEISNGTVDIISVSRDVGRRSYVAVRSNDPAVDPVAACTGIRGARVKLIVDELNREYLTVVRWEEAAERFITNALAPIPIAQVALEAQNRKAWATIDSARATGSTKIDRSNVHLASELTGWDIILLGGSED